jgi:hypothetical protein
VTLATPTPSSSAFKTTKPLGDASAAVVGRAKPILQRVRARSDGTLEQSKQFNPRIERVARQGILLGTPRVTPLTPGLRRWIQARSHRSWDELITMTSRETVCLGRRMDIQGPYKETLPSAIAHGRWAMVVLACGRALRAQFALLRQAGSRQQSTPPQRAPCPLPRPDHLYDHLASWFCPGDQ